MGSPFLLPVVTILSVLKQSSLAVVQWLGLGLPWQEAQVQSLVRELRSCKPQGVAKKERKKEEEKKNALHEQTPQSSSSF